MDDATRIAELEKRVERLEKSNDALMEGLEKAAEHIMSAQGPMGGMVRVMVPEELRKNLDLFISQRREARRGKEQTPIA